MATFFDQSTMQLASSFQTLVTALENEHKVLKNVSIIKDMVTLNSSSDETLSIVNNLVAIESAISKMEHNFSLFDENLRVEMEYISQAKLLTEQAKEQSTLISSFQSSLPTFLKEEVSISSSTSVPFTNDENANCSNVTNSNNNSDGRKDGTRRKSILKQGSTAPLAPVDAPKQQLGLVIEASEFEKVASVTRGRITLSQVNESVLIIKKLILSKQKIIRQFSKAPGGNSSSSTPRKASKAHSVVYEEYKKALRSEHDNCVFVSEAELRAAKFFDSGDGSGKNVIATLRSLARIKMIRSGNENTYVL